jgi:hypothetical protein
VTGTVVIRSALTALAVIAMIRQRRKARCRAAASLVSEVARRLARRAGPVMIPLRVTGSTARWDKRVKIRQIDADESVRCLGQAGGDTGPR